MGQGVLMEPSLERSAAQSGADAGFVSVVVPVVERADDLVTLYRTFAAELDARGEEHEFVFVFDGGFTPPPELAALSQERENLRFLRFARTFGETAALRLGIERSRGDVILTLPAYFQVKPEGIGMLLDALNDETDMVVASRSPRIDSWLNRLQSVAFNRMIAGRHRPAVPRHRLRRPGHPPDGGRGAAALRRPPPLHPGARAARGLPGDRGGGAPAPEQRPDPALRARGLRPAAARHRRLLLPRQVHREAAPLLRAGRLRVLPRRRGHLAGAAGQPHRGPGHRQPAAAAARGPAAGAGRAARWDSVWSARSSSICAHRTAGPIVSASGPERGCARRSGRCGGT